MAAPVRKHDCRAIGTPSRPRVLCPVLCPVLRPVLRDRGGRLLRPSLWAVLRPPEARGLAYAVVGAAAAKVLPPVQVPDDAFAFPVDPDFVPPPNAASQVAQADMAVLLAYADAAWKERQERHAVIVPALQAGGDTAAWQSLCAPSLHSVQRHSECWMFRDAVVPAAVPTLRHLELRRLFVAYLAVGVRVQPANCDHA